MPVLSPGPTVSTRPVQMRESAVFHGRSSAGTTQLSTAAAGTSAPGMPASAASAAMT